MDVLWQDNVASFLDVSNPDGAGGFADSAADAGSPWFASADGGVFSGQPTLWWSNDADSATTNPSFSPAGGFGPSDPVPSWILNGAEMPAGSNPSLGGGLLWADPASTTPNWLLINSGAPQFNVSADAGTPSQWLQFFGLTTPSQTWLTEASNMLWTDTTAQASGTPPFATAPQLAGGFLAPSFAALPTDHLVWTDPAQSFPGAISNPTAVSAAPTTLAGAGLFSQGMGLLPLLSGAGSH